MHARPIQVLLVKCDPATALRVHDALGDEPFAVHEVDSLPVAAKRLADEPVDVVVIDLALMEGAGDRTAQDVLGTPAHIPVVAITDERDGQPQATALAGGVYDYVGKDEISPGILLRSLRYAMDRHRLEIELSRLAHADHLTGLSNRRYLLKALDAAIGAARRHGHPLSLAVCDIDAFKTVNDRYGHGVGDATLQMIADALRDGVRAEDTAARFGGDEFCLLLPHVTRAGASHAVRRIQTQVAATAVPTPEGGAVRVTLTVGLAELSDDHPDAEALFLAADRALYRGKASGRAGLGLR